MTPPPRKDRVAETQQITYLPPPSGMVVVSTTTIRWAIGLAITLVAILASVVGQWFTTSAKLDEISRRLAAYETRVDGDERERQMLVARVAVLEDRYRRGAP